MTSSVTYLSLFFFFFFCDEISWRAGLKTSSHTVNCIQALLKASGNSPCKLRARWIKTHNQEKRKAWFLLLWWKGLIYLTLPSWWGYEMSQYKSYVRVGWGKSYRRDKNERNITTSCSEGTWAPICGRYFLSILLIIVVLSVWRRERKVLKTNLSFICTHIMGAGVWLT